jgi:XTP/dITP diphosphohydrolase
MPTRRLLLSTTNQHKLRELSEILRPWSYQVLSPADLGYLPQVEEDGETFAENAIKKAIAGLDATGEWTLADDSGIEARALGWRPGVHSARYAGIPCDDAANNAKLVRELESASDRYVRYRCVVALARPGHAVMTWEGTFAGNHLPVARGSGGFGYDPYVYLPDLGKTVAELDATQKHRISHRGQALGACIEYLRGIHID